MIPAIVINVDAAHAGSAGWAWAAGGMIVMAAVFYEAGMLVKGFLKSTGLILGAVLLMLVNVNNAMNNASATSDGRSDHRRTAMKAASQASSQRSQWSQGRTVQAQVAGETPAAAIEAEIEATTLRESGRWRATDQCDPLKTTARDSREFCSSIAQMKAKLAAAKKRDELDAKITALDAKRDGMDEVPTVVDPYVENMVMVLSFSGVEDTPTLRRLITASKDWVRALALELMATFGPSALLVIMLSGRRSDEAEAEAARVEKAAKAALPAPPKPALDVATAEIDPDVLAADDPIHGFIAAEMDEHVGSTMPAGEAWEMWQVYCGERNQPVGTQRSFGSRLKKIVAWEANNNRPRYLNVRRKLTAKPEQALRVVASNG